MEKNITQYIWLDAEFIKLDDAKISPLTHSLHYSGAVFEGVKSYNGKIFKLDEHTRRLLKSASDLEMHVNYSVEELNDAQNQLLVKNQLKDAYIRPLIWNGVANIGLSCQDPIIKTMIAVTKLRERDQNPIKLHISNWIKAHPKSLPPQCKGSANYGVSSLIKYQANELGFDDAILLDFEGFIAECITTNTFFVKNNILHTPIADRFLNGITRQTIIEIARSNNLDVIERRIKPEEILLFDECFLCGTASEVVLVRSIFNGKTIKSFTEYKISQFIKDKYITLVHS